MFLIVVLDSVDRRMFLKNGEKLTLGKLEMEKIQCTKRQQFQKFVQGFTFSS